MLHIVEFDEEGKTLMFLQVVVCCLSCQRKPFGKGSDDEIDVWYFVFTHNGYGAHALIYAANIWSLFEKYK